MTELAVPERAFPGRVRRRLRRWGGRLLGLSRRLGFGGLAVVGVAMGFYPGDAPTWAAIIATLGIFAVFVSPLLAIVGAALNARLPSHPARITPEKGRLSYRIGKLGLPAVLDRAGVDSGILVPTAKGFDLRVVEEDGNEISFLLDREVDATTILDALELDAAHRRTSISWRRFFDIFTQAVLSFVVASPLAFLVGMGVKELGYKALAGTLMLSLPFVVSALFTRVGSRREVAIGAEGFSHRFGWRRPGFVDFGDVEDVSLHHSTLIVGRRDGTKLHLKIDKGPELASAIHRRIQEARALLESADPATRATLFERGERDFDEWLEAMRSMLGKGATFRRAALRPDHALAVVEDIEAPLDARVGAALALSQLEGGAPGISVRAVAEASLHPRVRVVLEEAARGEVNEVDIEEALAEVTRGRKGRASGERAL